MDRSPGPAGRLCGERPAHAAPALAALPGGAAAADRPPPPFHAGRDPRRERPIELGGAPEASSEALAWELVCSDTRPSEAAARGERKREIQEALEQLDPVDREVLALRHFEQLSNVECARVLGLTESGGSRRYLRALERLKHVLTAGPGLRGGGES